MKYRTATAALLATLLAALATTPAQAEQLPLWEAGLGGAALSFPHYRGSDERQFWLLPFPYIIYRGEYLQADERRMRGIFFKTRRAEIDLSFNGSVPVDSDDNDARRGMPDLDGTLEIGPSLNVKLYEAADRRTQVELRLPVRAVLASDFSYVRQVGWIFQPNVSVDIRDPLGHAGWKLGMLAGPIFADQRYHRYVYEVAPQFATATRPAYTPDGGYSGTQMIVALSKRYPKYWVGGFVKWDTVNGAAFEDSPLVRQRQGFSAGFSIAWVLGESKTMVEATR
jgi:outer membrane protein